MSKFIEEVLENSMWELFDFAKNPNDTKNRFRNVDDAVQEALKDIETIVNGVIGENESKYKAHPLTYPLIDEANKVREEIRTNFNKVLRSK